MKLKTIALSLALFSFLSTACGDGKDVHPEESKTAGIGDFFEDIGEGIVKGLDAIKDVITQQIGKELVNQLPDWVIPTIGKVTSLLHKDRKAEPYRILLSHKSAGRAMSVHAFPANSGIYKQGEVADASILNKGEYPLTRMELKVWFTDKHWNGKDAAQVRIRNVSLNKCLTAINFNQIDWKPCFDAKTPGSDPTWFRQYFNMEKRTGDLQNLFRLSTTAFMQDPNDPSKFDTNVGSYCVTPHNNPNVQKFEKCNALHYEWSSLSNKDFK